MNENSLTVRSIAHDLNNQIMIVMNSIERLMILTPEDPDALEAMKAAERCAELTAQLYQLP